MTHPTDDEIMKLAGEWFHTGENQKRDDGYYYRSLGTPSNVRGSDLIEFARALLAEQARTEPVAEFSARVSMLLAHAKRGDRVSHDEVLEIAAMDPDELRRRAVVARDWHRAYQKCLDGLPLKAGAHHTVPAGCWFPKDIRMLVEQLLAAQPLKAEQAKDAAEDAPSDAARDVLAERQRQINAEGWTPKHDDEHDGHEMAHAAACYAYPELTALVGVKTWPWAAEWFKVRDHRSNYVRAAALLLAEIERIDRAARAKE